MLSVSLWSYITSTPCIISVGLELFRGGWAIVFCTGIFCVLPGIIFRPVISLSLRIQLGENLGKWEVLISGYLSISV